MCSSDLQAHIQLDMARIPLLEGVRELAGQGMITGASARNWNAYGQEVELAKELTALDQALLTDPQTSGGLLVACADYAVPEVLANFERHGFNATTEIGRVIPAHGHEPRLRVI